MGVSSQVFLWSLVVAVTALAAAADARHTPAIVSLRTSERHVAVLFDGALFIAGELRTSGRTAVRSWSLEQKIGDFHSVVEGSLGRHHLVVTHRGVRVAGAYPLTCIATRSASHSVDATSERRRDVAPDGSILFEVRRTEWRYFGPLDCTLTMPDGRTLHGTGNYQAMVERTRRTEPAPPTAAAASR